MNQIEDASTGEQEAEPVYSPDFRYIAGASTDKRKHRNLWVIDANTGGKVLRRDLGRVRKGDYTRVGVLTWKGPHRLRAEIDPPNGKSRKVTYRIP